MIDGGAAKVFAELIKNQSVWRGSRRHFDGRLQGESGCFFEGVRFLD
jgi:hypothetical protein